MLNKRGIGHEIDWIIGIGLFLVSVIFIFVLFRPGITKLYDSETLLDIIQDGFNNDTEWSLTNVPIFIYPANESYVADPAIVTLLNQEINVSCDLNDCQTASFDGVKKLILGRDKTNIKIYYIKRDQKDRISGDFNIDKNKDNPELVCNKENKCKRDPKLIDKARKLYQISDFMREGNMVYNLTENLLSIPARLEKPIDKKSKQPLKTKYLLSVSDRPINFEVSNITQQNLPKYIACSKKDESQWPYNKAVAEKCPVVYEFGTTEFISGIDLASFLNLNQTTLESNCIKGYDCIKEKWKFPVLKEFTIKIESLPIGANKINITVIFPDKVYQRRP